MRIKVPPPWSCELDALVPAAFRSSDKRGDTGGPATFFLSGPLLCLPQRRLRILSQSLTLRALSYGSNRLFPPPCRLLLFPIPQSLLKIVIGAMPGRHRPSILPLNASSTGDAPFPTGRHLPPKRSDFFSPPHPLLSFDSPVVLNSIFPRNFRSGPYLFFYRLVKQVFYLRKADDTPFF